MLFEYIFAAVLRPYNQLYFVFRWVYTFLDLLLQLS